MHRPGLVLCSLLPLLSSCEAFQFHGTITTTKTKDGQTVTETQEFDDWGEMKKAMKKEAKEMAAFTAELSQKLIKDMVEAPPPGEVKIGDLSPNLAKFEGDATVDFIAQAKAEGATEFSYVQIGVPTYDQFFKVVAEFHAFTYEMQHAIHALHDEASAALKGKVDVKGLTLLDLAQAATGGEVQVEASAQAHVLALANLTTAIAASAPAYAAKVQELIVTGEQLVAGAAASITNPKTVLHLDLIVKGLGQSIKMVGASGKLLVEMTGEVAGFAKAPAAGSEDLG